MKEHLDNLKIILMETIGRKWDAHPQEAEDRELAKETALRYAIERLSNQERIAEHRCDQCAELEDLLGDIKPDADSDASGTLVERVEALLELAQLDKHPDAWLENLRGTGEEKP